MNPQTNDQDARSAIDRFHNQTQIVEAGAGAGKTTHLVERIVAMVTSEDQTVRMRMRNLVVVTFTKKAARELNDRIRAKLEGMRDSNRFASDALDEFGEAVIGTIHHLAKEVIQFSPHSVGITSPIQVIEELEERSWFRDFWECRIQLCAAAGLSESLSVAWNALPGLNALEPLVVSAAAFEEDFPIFSTDDDILSALASIANSSFASLDEGLSWVSRLQKLSAKKKKEEPVTSQLSRLVELQSVAVSRVFFCLASHYRTARDARVSNGILTNDDLIRLAPKVLKENADLRERLRNRWKRMLVDEFQDTDRGQVELFHWLTAENPDREWGQYGFDPERLFFVGDPKQSIYRFRGADVSVFYEVQKLIQESNRLSLTTNFRSTQELVSVFNDGFTPCFEEGFYSPMEFHGSGQADTELPASESVVEKPIYIDTEELSGNASTVRAKRAESARNLVQELIAKKPEVKFSDIAILIRTRTDLPPILRAFSNAQIPCRIESRSLLFETVEALELICLLKAIAFPSDRVAVAGTLRSALFGFTDRELAEFIRAGGRFNSSPNSIEVRSEGTDRIQESLQEIFRWSEESRKRPFPEVLERILTEKHHFALYTSAPQFRESWRRILQFIQFARSWYLDNHGSLREFVRYLDELQKEREFDDGVSVPEEDNNAVRIMTIHASKGLEFPYVMFYSLAGSRARSYSKWVRFQNGTWQVRFNKELTYNIELDSGDALDEIEKGEDEKELVRLAYVCATRSRFGILIPAFERGKDNIFGGKFVHEILDRGHWLQVVPSQPLAPTLVATVANQHPAQWKPYQPPVLDEGLRRSSYSSKTATALMREPSDEEPDALKNAESDESVAGIANSSDSLRLGNALHQVMERVNPSSTSEEVEQCCQYFAAASEVAHCLPELRTMIANALDHPFWRSGQCFPEIYLSHLENGELYEGFLDLLIEQPGNQYLIVDYKTNQVKGSQSAQKIKESYEAQAALYSRMVRKNFNASSVSFQFILVRQPGVRGEFTNEDLMMLEEKWL